MRAVAAPAAAAAGERTRSAGGGSSRRGRQCCGPWPEVGVAWGRRKGGQAAGGRARQRNARGAVRCGAVRWAGKAGQSRMVRRQERAGRRGGRWEQMFRNWAAACWIMERSAVKAGVGSFLWQPQQGLCSALGCPSFFAGAHALLAFFKLSAAHNAACSPPTRQPVSVAAAAAPIYGLQPFLSRPPTQRRVALFILLPAPGRPL